MKDYMGFVLKIELPSNIQPSHFHRPFLFKTFISHILCFHSVIFVSQQMLRPNDGRGRNLLKSPF